jgi:hypothetical protein
VTIEAQKRQEVRMGYFIHNDKIAFWNQVSGWHILSKSILHPLNRSCTESNTIVVPIEAQKRPGVQMGSFLHNDKTIVCNRVSGRHTVSQSIPHPFL